MLPEVAVDCPLVKHRKLNMRDDAAYSLNHPELTEKGDQC